MSIIFPDGLPTTDRFGNEIYTDFRNMIRVEYLMEDPSLTEAEKLVRGLQLLYGEIPEDLAIEDAVGELLWFYSRGETPESSGSGSSKKLYDFEQDGDHFYASFMMAYHIDLTSKKELHWWKFLALMSGLSEDTPLSKILYYRNLDTSQMKGQQKKDAEKLKKLYALKKKGATAKRLKTLKERLDARYAEIKKNGV